METGSSPWTIPPSDIPPLPCSIRVRVRSGVSRVRVRIRVKFMVWVRGECPGGENLMSREMCPTLRKYTVPYRTVPYRTVSYRILAQCMTMKHNTATFVSYRGGMTCWINRRPPAVPSRVRRRITGLHDGPRHHSFRAAHLKVVVDFC